MSKFALPLVCFGCLLLSLSNSAAAATPGECFCIKYLPGKMPPYYIGRFTPPSAGCENVKYEPKGNGPEEDGLRSCDAVADAKKGGAAKAGEISRNRVYGYASKNDGEGLKKYLAPFFEKGEVPEAALVFGLKGGFRSFSRVNEPAVGVSSILASKNSGGKMVFAEVFGLGDAGAEWFKNAARVDDGRSTWGSSFFSKGELICIIKFPGGETDEIHVRKYGRDLITRQIRRSAEGTQTEYGFYYMDLGRIGR